MAAENKVLLQIMTPKKVFYSQEVEMVIVEETLGKEGYMAGHSPALKLLKDGEIRIKEAGSQEMKTAMVPGGYIYAGDCIGVYSPQASWRDTH